MPTYYLKERFIYGTYQLSIHQFRKETVLCYSGVNAGKSVPVIAILVEYVNETHHPFKYQSSQWELVDLTGRRYKFGVYGRFSESNRHLTEGLLNPGQRVKGWVAFETAEGVEVDYVQFRKNYTAPTVAIKLEPAPPKIGNNLWRRFSKRLSQIFFKRHQLFYGSNHDPQMLTKWGRGTPYTYCLQEPATLYDCEVTVLEFKKELVFDSGDTPKQYVPVVRVLVQYMNQSKNQPLSYSTLQWLLYDTDGYVYAQEIRTGLYGEDIPLSNGLINSGNTIKGWVAFITAEGVEVNYVQFRKNYSTNWVIDFKLQPSPNPQ